MSTSIVKYLALIYISDTQQRPIKKAWNRKGSFLKHRNAVAHVLMILLKGTDRKNTAHNGKGKKRYPKLKSKYCSPAINTSAPKITNTATKLDLTRVLPTELSNSLYSFLAIKEDHKGILVDVQLTTNDNIAFRIVSKDDRVKCLKNKITTCPAKSYFPL